MPVAGRVASAAVLLVIGAGLALLAVLVHYEFMRIYGDVSGTAFEGLTWGLTAGPSGLAFGLVAVVAMIGFIISTRRWMRLTAVAIPVLMLIGMCGRERFQWPFSGSYMFRPGFQMLDVSWVLYVPAWMLFD